MTVAVPTAAQLIEAARALAPQIRALRDEIEAERSLPVPLVAALRRAGLFRLWLPQPLGGFEVDPAAFIRIVEQVAQIDGAAGWNLMIGAGTNFFLAFLRDDVARTIVAGDPDLITGGTLSLQGRAIPVQGGYRVSGRWPFGSGCRHCSWLVGNCLVFEGGKQRIAANGLPDSRLAFFPPGGYEIIDTWHVGGLRGTGSQDYAVSDLFVPEERTFALGWDQPCQPGRLYAIPQGGLFACALTAVPLGIARGAIDALIELAAAKTATGQSIRLRERAAVQADVARAEAMLRSARAFVFETLTEAQAILEGGGEVPLQLRALMRSAATHATVTAAQVVDLMYNAGGASSIYTTNPLERAFRDVHVATQHAMVSPATLEPAGKILLGLDLGPTRF